MSAIVIDTNILLVADGQASHMSPACKIECLNRLEDAQAREKVVLDHQRMILNEYGNKLNPSKRPPSTGKCFLKWLLVNQRNSLHTAMINLTPPDKEKTHFAEFPCDAAWNQPSIHPIANSCRRPTHIPTSRASSNPLTANGSVGKTTQAPWN